MWLGWFPIWRLKKPTRVREDTHLSLVFLVRLCSCFQGQARAHHPFGPFLGFGRYTHRASNPCAPLLSSSAGMLDTSTFEMSRLYSRLDNSIDFDRVHLQPCSVNPSQSSEKSLFNWELMVLSAKLKGIVPEGMSGPSEQPVQRRNRRAKVVSVLTKSGRDPATRPQSPPGLG